MPAFNEAERIGEVLQTLRKVRGLDGVLVVDDGSSDGTQKAARLAFPSVRVLKLSNNSGKAAAVLAGAKAVQSEYLLLVDADLHGLRVEEFEAAIKAVRRDAAIDMLVLRRVNKDWVTRALRGDVLISGERIVRRSHLLALFASQQPAGFQLEVALNQYMLDHSKQVRWLPISSAGVISLRKRGLLAGLRKELSMFAGIFAYLGPRKLVQQMLAFGRQRA